MVVTAPIGTDVSYSSDAAAQEGRSRRTSFTSLRDTGPHVIRPRPGVSFADMHRLIGAVALTLLKCKHSLGECCMIDIHSQILGARDSWNAAPSRAVGLYGELQPVPFPVPAPVSSAMTRKPRPKAGVTG